MYLTPFFSASQPQYVEKYILLKFFYIMYVLEF